MIFCEIYEQPLPESYIKAFQAITADPNNELIVPYNGNDIIEVQQITFTPYFTYQGEWRATIGGVRTISSERGIRDRNLSYNMGNPTCKSSWLSLSSAYNR
jgi:hypothetical protein